MILSDIKIAVIGLGYVGLPIAVEFGKHYDTLGFDINAQRVEQLRMRRSSPNYGKWFGVELSASNRRQLWIPPGFAHGFLVTSPSADFLYKTTDYYSPEHERCVLWNDPAMGIDWPLISDPLVSAKDAAGKLLADAECY